MQSRPRPYPPRVRWPSGHSDQNHQLLAMVEAEVGSLLEVLPVALVVTSSQGDVLRANPTAEALLGWSETLLGKQIDEILSERPISVRVRTLCHEGETMRLYVLQGESRHILFGPD